MDTENHVEWSRLHGPSQLELLENSLQLLHLLLPLTLLCYGDGVFP